MAMSPRNVSSRLSRYAGSPMVISAWAGLRVTVPDYAPSGIQLIGARLADAREQPVAHLLYEKGRTLVSVFVLATPEGDAGLHGTRVSYRGAEYRTDTRNGYHTVAWAEGGGMFGLVSRLAHDALLECADRLRHERAGMMPL